jgi:hypothetical protein
MASFCIDPFVFDNKFIKTNTIDPDLESIIITDPFYVPISKYTSP